MSVGTQRSYYLTVSINTRSILSARTRHCRECVCLATQSSSVMVGVNGYGEDYVHTYLHVALPFGRATFHHRNLVFFRRFCSPVLPTHHHPP